MPFIAINAAEITCELDIPGDAGPANIVFGVDGSTLLSATAIDSALQAVFPAAGGWREMYGSWVTLTKATTRFRSSPTVVEIAESVYSLAGLRSGVGPPPQVATLISKTTGLAGRQNRGRMYFPALSENLISDGGIITEADRLLVQAGADQFLSDLSTSSIPMVILHTNPAVTPTAVSALNVSTKVATQRRRLR